MKRGHFRAELSAALDGYDLSTAARRHLEVCPDCQAFGDDLTMLRQAAILLKTEPGLVPDVTPRVLARVGGRRSAKRPWAIVTGFAVGAVVGAVVAGGVSGPKPSLARELSEAVVAGQSSVDTLSATFSITERVSPGVERIYRGELAYRSPEFLLIEVVQLEAPLGWAPNSWLFGVDGDTVTLTEPFPCPVLGGCADGTTRRRVISGREPFSTVFPAPLDIVVPASVLRNSAEPPLFEGGDRLGRPTVAFTVSAAQARALLDAYFGVGNWRQIHPTDSVRIWLDRDRYIPLAVTVTAGESIDRQLWATRRGYADDLETPYLVVDYLEVDVDGEVNVELATPEGATFVDAGFRREAVGPPPVDPGMPLVASGIIAGVVPAEVWAWSDGRAWIRLVRSTEWAAPGLFGNDGSGVRPVDGSEGPVYLAGNGGAVFVHALGFDVVVTGSVETATLLETALAMPGARLAVSADWPEAPALPNLVAGAWLPAGMADFADPIVRSAGDAVLIDLFAAGDRSAQITIRPASLLSPPLDPDARAVEVRGLIGRYSPMLGLLEWTEEEHSISIGSASLSLDEVLAIAGVMVKP